MSLIPPLFDYNRIIRALARDVTNRAIRKVKRRKIPGAEILIGAGLAAVHSNLKSKKPKRKDFSKSTQKVARERQKNKCNICKKKTDVWEYDHINGNSVDNSLENCQALCPICHARKTRKIQPKKRRFFQKIKLKKGWLKKRKKKLFF